MSKKLPWKWTVEDAVDLTDFDKIENEMKTTEIKEEFWYESNAYFGWVRNLKDLNLAMYYQFLDSGFTSLDDILSRSFQNVNGTLDFGTRREHTGKLSLKDFLIKQNFDLDKIDCTELKH